MKINRHQSSHKKLIAIVVAVLVVAAGGAGFYYFLQKNQSTPVTDVTKSSDINYSPATNDQISAGQSTKSNSVNPNNTSKPNVSGSDQAAAPVPESNGKSSVSATMTAANQNGSVLQLRFALGTVTSSGACTLTLKKDSSTVTKTANVQALAGSSTCQGFDVPTSELSAGTWKVSLHFENSSLTADTSGSTVVK